MRHFFIATLVVLTLACREQVPEIPAARPTIGVEYVGAPELVVYEKMDDLSPVATKFLSGEAVSILARNGDWVEVRTATGSGWAHAGGLTTAANAVKEEAQPTPKFRTPPSPVTQPGVHGTVYIEAAVNTDGEVTSVKLITNSTGSDSLATKNAEALRQAKFYPIVQKGKKKGFLYYYRVDY